MHAYAGVFTQTSSVKPNPFANVTIKNDVIFTFKLCIPGLPPAIEGLGTRLLVSIIQEAIVKPIIIFEAPTWCYK